MMCRYRYAPPIAAKQVYVYQMMIALMFALCSNVELSDWKHHVLAVGSCTAQETGRTAEQICYRQSDTQIKIGAVLVSTAL